MEIVEIDKKSNDKQYFVAHWYTRMYTIQFQKKSRINRIFTPILKSECFMERGKIVKRYVNRI